MTVHIVRLGSKRARGEGPRLGTVRRPPRGVPRERFARDDYYDVWFPLLAPSDAAVKLGLSAKTPAQWKRFERRYLAEMKRPEARQALDVLALLSRSASFAVGCYCEDEARCHRSLLRRLLKERGARVT
ncbi:MAG: DUF488 family protein [Archangiaceae bacterium]|nr:DUF488 family protein [Archangiaceae bacterium]